MTLFLCVRWLCGPGHKFTRKGGLLEELTFLLAFSAGVLSELLDCVTAEPGGPLAWSLFGLAPCAALAWRAN